MSLSLTASLTVVASYQAVASPEEQDKIQERQLSQTDRASAGTVDFAGQVIVNEQQNKRYFVKTAKGIVRIASSFWFSQTKRLRGLEIFAVSELLARSTTSVINKIDDVLLLSPTRELLQIGRPRVHHSIRVVDY